MIDSSRLDGYGRGRGEAVSGPSLRALGSTAGLVSVAAMPTDARGGAILIAQGEDAVLSCDDTVHTETPFASPLKSPASERDRYERLREEAARHGTQMLEEEKERNREVTLCALQAAPCARVFQLCGAGEQRVPG